MGVRVQVDAHGRTYTVVEGPASIFEVLVAGTVVDDVTGLVPRTTLELETSREGVFLKALDNGTFCLAGDLEWVLPEHATTAHSLSVTISAPGYLPQTLAVSVPAASALPVALAQVRLRPLPVRVRGRVVQSSMNRAGEGGALVRIADVGAQGRVTLRTPLHADHSATTPVQRRSPVRMNAVRTLARDAERGTNVLPLTGRAVAGTPIFGLEPARRLEFVLVAAAGPGPGEVTLTQPLTRSYLVGTEVDEFTFSTPAGSPVRRLTREALAGDALLLLDDVIGLAATAVQVGDAAAGPIELHAVDALADADGYYALDGIGGVTEITLRARPTPTGTEGPALAWTLDYSSSSNLVNLQLAP